MNTFFLIIGIIAIFKIILLLLISYGSAYLHFAWRYACFFLVLIMLMLPIGVETKPSWHIVMSLSWLNAYTVLIFPLLASITAIFLFRQFFFVLPPGLAKLAKLEDVSKLDTLWDVMIPLSKVNLVFLAILMFVYGWSQAAAKHKTILNNLMDMQQMPQWSLTLLAIALVLLPSVIIIFVMQRWVAQEAIWRE